MQFIVNSSRLMSQLSGISGVINANPVVPILENFLFVLSHSTLTITASDLLTSMITHLPVESKEDGKVAVPARILLDTLKNLSNQPITFSIDLDTYSIEIVSENGRYRLSGENASDFPKIPDNPNDFSVAVSSDTLGKVVGQTIFATSNDELRPSMTGVYVNINQERTLFVATDGHRLVRYRRDDMHIEDANAVIVPRKALHLLRTVLPSEPIDVKIAFTVSNAFFHFGNLRMVSRLIDERFPDYENVIPTQNPIKMIISRMELLSSIRRIAIYANRTTHQVKLALKGSELQVSAEDLDFSNEASERLSCEHEGEDIAIGFNARFLIEMLSSLDAEQIQISMSTPSKAGVIAPVDKQDNEEILMLAMPVTPDP